MAAHNMRKVEVGYELKIRGISADGNAGELRKRLSAAMAVNSPVIETVVNSLDPDAELQSCKEIYADLSSLISEYGGDYNDNEYQRIVTRLWHLYSRIERIPIAAADLEDTKENIRTDLFKKTKKLMDSFIVDPKPKPLELYKSNDQQAPPKAIVNEESELKSSSVYIGLDNQVPLNVSQEPPKQISVSSFESKISEIKYGPQKQTYRAPITKTVPVYKWGLKFDNQAKQSVGAFLERVEELSRARGITHKELFESAVDLFSGQALIWYRSAQSRVGSWEELKREMKIVFQTPDYDFRLQQEIFSRIQGENESIDLYIAAMEGLYGRLSIQIPEATRLAQIYHNLHPQLHDRLALCDIRTIGDLRQMGRKVEAGRLRASAPRQPSRNVSTLEPDLAYDEPSHRRGPPTTGRISSLNQRFDKSSSSGSRENICWNCGDKGHVFRLCKKPRNKFCFGCGTPDKVKRECEKCHPPKNL